MPNTDYKFVTQSDKPLKKISGTEVVRMGEATTMDTRE
jgi:hypothetical protein